jgi:DNA polymerase I-like protein with 3'-5' exonuclease and polymerase domains
MRVLVNYTASEKGNLTQLAYLLKKHGISAASTSIGMTIGELMAKAKAASCNAILLCNEETLRNCVPGDAPTLDNFRGSRLNFEVPTIVCNFLDHINTVPHGQWLLEKDISKIASINKPIQQFTQTILDDVGKFPAALAIMKQALFLSYDVETITLNEDEDTGKAGETIITCASWTAVMPNMELITHTLPLVDFGIDHWTNDFEYETALGFLREVNKLPNAKAMQNGQYDALHSIRYHAEPLNFCLDTMGMAHSEYSELPKSLDFIASYQLYDYVQWKDDSQAASKNKDIRKYWAYNGKDTWYTARIAIEQLRTMPVYARKNYARQFKLNYPALYCAFEGWKVNNETRLRLRAKSVEIVEEARRLLRIMFADPNFNPGSWQQVEKYIYTVFGAKKPKIGKSKSCTDEKNLNAVALQHPLLAMLTTRIIDYRGEQKAVGTYYDFLQINNRLLYNLDPFGTDTSRMASRSSSLWCGTQIQNIPSYAKEMLEADEGYELIEPDMSQAEARCTAYCSQETKLIAALEDKERDFYKTLGTLFFQMKYEDVTDFFRNKVLKKVVHGTNYMMGAKTFIENITIVVLHKAATAMGIKLVPTPRKNTTETTILAFAQSLLETYHVPFPRVRLWYKEIYHEIATTGKLVGPTGNVRVFFGDITKRHEMLRGAVAHQPQNLSVSILNEGYWKVYKQLVIPSKGEFRLKAQVHDSMPAQYPIAKRDYYVPRMLALMENPVLVHGRWLKVPIDAKIGNNWANMEKYKPVPKETVNA